MDISGALQSGKSFFHSCGTSLYSAASSVVEKGKMGCDKTVTLIRENPKTAVITGLAIAATLVGVAYAASCNCKALYRW